MIDENFSMSLFLNGSIKRRIDCWWSWLSCFKQSNIKFRSAFTGVKMWFKKNSINCSRFSYWFFFDRKSRIIFMRISNVPDEISSVSDIITWKKCSRISIKFAENHWCSLRKYFITRSLRKRHAPCLQYHIRSWQWLYNEWRR